MVAFTLKEFSLFALKGHFFISSMIKFPAKKVKGNSNIDNGKTAFAFVMQIRHDTLVGTMRRQWIECKI